MEISLRDSIVEILARHDPLEAMTLPEIDAEDVYGAEGEDITEIVVGEPFLPDECAAVVWAILTQRLGADEVGPVERYAAIGIEIAAAVAASDEVASSFPSEADDEDDGPSELLDVLDTAVLGILDDHDPAGIIDLDLSPLEHTAAFRRYETIAQLIAAQIGTVELDEHGWAAAVAEMLLEEFGTVADAPLALVGAELAELAPLAPLVVRDLPSTAQLAIEIPQDEPRDPLVAGIVALLVRHDVSDLDEVASGVYPTIAEEVAKLARDTDPDAVVCRAIVWAVCRQWGIGAEPVPLAAFEQIGRELAELTTVYRELAERSPELIGPGTRDGASMLAEEPFALAVHGALLAHDPFDLVADDAATTDYVPYAREIAARLASGSASAGWCQVLVWKVLTDPWGGLGGSIGRFRELGAALHALTRGR
jgi:hypothetical protein